MKTTAQSPRQLCIDVQAHGSSKARLLIARPWQFQDADDTLWWLVPSSEWPAYRHAKLFFDWFTRKKKDRVWTGINVEKGLGAVAASVYPSKFIMSQDWAWHRFCEDCRSGLFDQVIADSTYGETSQTWWLKIAAGYVDKPSGFDPLSQSFRDARAFYCFRKNPGASLWELTESNDPRKTASASGMLSQLSDMPDIVAKLQQRDWLWIDVYCGISLEVVGPEEISEVTTAAQVWSSSLSRFERWLPG